MENMATPLIMYRQENYLFEHEVGVLGGFAELVKMFWKRQGRGGGKRGAWGYSMKHAACNASLDGALCAFYL